MRLALPAKIFFITSLVVFATTAEVAPARADVVPRPEFGILDRVSLFPLPILKVTEKILAEHEQLTQERISIVTDSELSGDVLRSTSRDFFEAWRIDAPRPPNALVIMISDKNGELEVATGLGIDPVLPAARIGEIRRDIFRPEWENEKKTRAIILSVVEILRILESPLVAGGEAVDAYERAGFSGGWKVIPRTKKNITGWIWIGVGFVVFGLVLQKVLVAEVHYTAGGWDRIPAWRGFSRILRRKPRGPKLVSGGGISGKY